MMNRDIFRDETRLAWWDLLLGVWLVISPFGLGFAHNSAMTWNNVVLGIAVAILSLASRPDIIKGLLVLAGAWLFAATFVLGFARSVVVWNNLLVALFIIIGALQSEIPRLPKNPEHRVGQR